MFGRSGTVSLPTIRALAHAMAGFVLAIGLTIAATETAQACPKEKASVTITHKASGQAKNVAVVMAVAAVPSFARNIFAGGGLCCGGSHTFGGSCANTCCSVCSTAINVMSSDIGLPNGSIRHHLPAPDRVVSTQPPPDVRPPRIFG